MFSPRTFEWKTEITEVPAAKKNYFPARTCGRKTKITEVTTTKKNQFQQQEGKTTRKCKRSAGRIWDVG